MTKLYHLICVNDKTGRKVYLTEYPMTHEECMVMKSKQSPKPPHIRIAVEPA